jgi:hypothetical protein
LQERFQQFGASQFYQPIIRVVAKTGENNSSGPELSALAKSESRTINSAEPIESNAGPSIAELSRTRSLRKSERIY